MAKSAQFVSFLKRELDRRKQSNSRYSLRSFARDLSLSPAELSRLMNSKRGVTIASMKKILSQLKLTDVERKTLLSDLVSELAPTNEREIFEPLPEHFYEIISEWEHTAILALAQVRSFVLEPEVIAEELGIAVAKAKRALDRLKSVGMLVQNAMGEWQPLYTRFESVTDVPNEAVRQWNRQLLQRAQHSLDAHSVERRDIQSITFAIDTAMIPEAKKLVRKFRDDMSALVTKGVRDEVYSLAVALFPLRFK